MATAWLFASFILAFIGLCFLSGCASPFSKRGRIKSGDVTVQGPPNPGTPTTLATTNAGTTVPLPAGSTITVTKEEARPAQPATATAPAVPAQPARETTVIAPAGPTEYHQTVATVKADTGTVDTSVAIHAQNVAERRWLLWVAIGCMVAGFVIKAMMPAWPSLSNGLLLAAVVAGVSWKLAEIPTWIWAVVLVIAGALAMGYKRAEWDKDGDGTPDILQRKKTVTTSTTETTIPPAPPSV